MTETLRDPPAPEPSRTPMTEGLAGGETHLPVDVPPQLAGHARYRILARLGEGGMGTVYKAEHRIMERIVALKVVAPHLVANPQAVERFRQEVRAAAKLSHPNIVIAHDADQADDLHFLVMEHVEGISLARLVDKKGPQPIHYACAFARQTALGLQHAHDQGMIHRDIKPQNLIVTKKGLVKILDFGLARFASATRKEAQVQQAAKALTAADVVLGTPDFLAPEQARDSRSVDHRADLYSLGCTLYYLLSGGVPFPGGSSLEKLFAQCEAEPTPLESLRKDVPPEVSGIVRKLMAKKADERYASAADAAAALAPFAVKGGGMQGSALPLLTAAAEEMEVELVEEEKEAPTRFKMPAAKTHMMHADAMEATPSTTLAMPHRRRQGDKPPKPAAIGKSKPPWWSKRKGPLIGGAAGLLALVVLAIVIASRPGKEDDKTPPADGKAKPRVLFVLAPWGFHAGDYREVRDALEEQGAEMVVASTDRKPCEPQRFGPGAGGHPVKPDVLLKEAKAKDYAAVIFCGGPGYDHYTGDRPGSSDAKRIINDMLDVKRPVAAICMGPAILADAKILKGRNVTGFEKVEGLLWSAHANVKRQAVVEDGLLVTARDKDAAKPFVEAVLRAAKK